MTECDVIIFAGQSNMQGQTESLDAFLTENAYEYKYLSDSIIPLIDPAGENILYDGTAGVYFSDEIDPVEWDKTHVFGGASYGHSSLVPSFCKEYISLAEVPVIAVHVAKGATRICDWMPSTVRYEMLLKKSTAAIKKASERYKVRHIFFVWLQGESDAIYRTSAEEYINSLTIFNNSLKKDAGIEKFGIIRVGRFTGNESDDVIINAQDKICLENDDFLMLTDIAVKLNSDQSSMNPFVGGHFGTKGLKTLGISAAETLYKYIKET